MPFVGGVIPGHRDPEVVERRGCLTAQVEGVRALVEPVALTFVGGCPPAEPAPTFVHDDRASRPRDERRRGETAEPAADDMNLCIFHTPTTTTALGM